LYYIVPAVGLYRPVVDLDQRKIPVVLISSDLHDINVGITQNKCLMVMVIHAVLFISVFVKMEGVEVNPEIGG
jgi:hypothetical protein